jgi:hypothetical protein
MLVVKVVTVVMVVDMETGDNSDKHMVVGLAVTVFGIKKVPDNLTRKIKLTFC